MNKKHSTAAKLSLMLCVLGFLNVTLLNFLGLIVGLFLTTIGVYIAEDKVRKKNKNDDFANIAVYFGIATLLFVGGLGAMFGYLSMFR